MRMWVGERGDQRREPQSEPDEEATTSGDDEVPSSSTLCQEFWAYVTNSPARACTMKQWILLAQLIFVMVPGSVEEERMFSAMKYLKNQYRNRLLEVHLTICARAFHHHRVTLANFPYKQAIRFWLEQKARRMV